MGANCRCGLNVGNPCVICNSTPNFEQRKAALICIIAKSMNDRQLADAIQEYIERVKQEYGL